MLVWVWHLTSARTPMGASTVSALQSLVSKWRSRAILPLRRF